MSKTGKHNEFENDRSLCRRLRAGDWAAHKEFNSRFRTPLYFIAYGILENKEDAEDVAQKTIYKVLKGIYNGLSLDRDDLSHYICKAGKNNAFEEARTRTKHRTLLEENQGLIKIPISFKNEAEQRMTLRDLEYLMNKYLDNIEKLIIKIYYLEGYKDREIAVKLNQKKGTVTQKRLRAIIKLQKGASSEGWTRNN